MRRELEDSYSQERWQNAAHLSVAIAQEVESLFYHLRIELGQWLSEGFEDLPRALPNQVLHTPKFPHPVLNNSSKLATLPFHN